MYINEIRNKRANTTTHAMEIHRIMKDYFEQLYAHKLDNLEEMINS